jgi:hypothetical protein
MIQDYTIAGASAPTSAPYIHKPLHPKTITVFLDAGVSGKNRAAHAVCLHRSSGRPVICADATSAIAPHSLHRTSVGSLDRSIMMAPCPFRRSRRKPI